MFSDAHTHFTGSPLYPDFGGAPLIEEEVQELMTESRAKGVGLMVVASHDLPSANKAFDLAAREGEVYAAVGLHPWVATTLDEESYRRFLDLAKKPKVVAVSEVGLDKTRSRATLETQLQTLRQMLRLSSETGHPAMIHDKGYHEELMQLLRTERPPIGAAHGFEGNESELADWLNLGYYVSIGRAILAPGSERLKPLVLKIPQDRLLTETDSASRNAEGVLEGQARVVQVTEVLADWLAMSVSQLGDLVTTNLRTLLRI